MKNGSGEVPERVRHGEPSPRRNQGLTYTVAAALALAGLAAAGQASTLGAVDSSSVFLPIPGLVTVLVVLGLLILDSLFVLWETAVVMLRPLHVKHLREKDEATGARLQKLLDDQHSYVSAARFGKWLTRIMIFASAILLAPGLLRLGETLFGWDAALTSVQTIAGSTVRQMNIGNIVLGTIVVMIPIGVVELVAEQIPRTYASIHPHDVSARWYRMIRLTRSVFRIPTAMVTGLTHLLSVRMGARGPSLLLNQAEEEIKTLVETAQESGEIEIDEKRLLHSVFEFADTIAREVMTPRVDLDAVSVDSDPREVMEIIKESGHSRIPIYEATDDQIVGIVHAKDLLMAMLNGSPPSLRSLMRPALFVPESKDLHELLAEMRLNRTQLAIVQDEFGGTAGIVTIEDIVEELVGDILDEYDIEEPEIVADGDAWVADGRAHIDDINDEVGSDFESEEFDTVGGLVFGLFGRQPQLSESIEADGYRFTVVETDGRRILKLRIEQLPHTAETELTAAES